jgi:hypothetical protein
MKKLVRIKNILILPALIAGFDLMYRRESPRKPSRPCIPSPAEAMEPIRKPN